MAAWPVGAITSSLGAADDRGGPGASAGAEADAGWGQKRDSRAAEFVAGQERSFLGSSAGGSEASRTLVVAGERKNEAGDAEGEEGEGEVEGEVEGEGEGEGDQEDASGVLHVARVIAACQAGGEGGGVCDVGMRGAARLPRQLLRFFRCVGIDDAWVGLGLWPCLQTVISLTLASLLAPQLARPPQPQRLEGCCVRELLRADAECRYQLVTRFLDGRHRLARSMLCFPRAEGGCVRELLCPANRLTACPPLELLPSLRVLDLADNCIAAGGHAVGQHNGCNGTTCTLWATSTVERCGQWPSAQLSVT